MKRNIFIGDIHGCIGEFESLLDKIELSSTDNLRLVWDTIHGWPASIEVLKLIESLWDRVVSVLWNHEHFFCRRIDVLCSPNDTAPIPEYTRNLARELKNSDRINQILQFPYLFEDDISIVIHQWLIPGIQVKNHHQELQKKWKNNSKNWYLEYTWKKKVIYGHRVFEWWKRYWNTLWIDTWCVHWGYLSAYILEEDRIIQQKCFQDWGY